MSDSFFAPDHRDDGTAVADVDDAIGILSAGLIASGCCCSCKEDVVCLTVGTGVKDFRGFRSVTAEADPSIQNLKMVKFEKGVHLIIPLYSHTLPHDSHTHACFHQFFFCRKLCVWDNLY